jgi:hypothetical protein
MLAAFPDEAWWRRDLCWSTRPSFFRADQVFRGKVILQELKYSSMNISS